MGGMNKRKEKIEICIYNGYVYSLTAQYAEKGSETV
jgi:hypothetical protein